MRLGIRRFLASKFFLVPLGALLLFTLTGFILAPIAVRWYVPKYMRDQFKCQAALGDVRINPYLLRFYFDCELTGFFHMAAHFKEIRLEKPSASFVVEVADNGSGIEEEIRDRIFDPFFTTKEPASGTGLGLYISYNQVKSLAGTIEVESMLGQGSTFLVVVPQVG